MKKVLIFLIFILVSETGYAQKVSIVFESNSRTERETKQNPFEKFIGEWTLKNDDWTHNWGNGTETIKIPKHHTTSQGINTDNSLLSIIDGPEPNGHIFWSYNPITKEVYHLSSFGTIRAGNGKGTINSNGDVKLKLVFEGEPEGTYRIYNYKWINDNEYHMKSVQFSEKGIETGLFYEGNFVRVEKSRSVSKNDMIEQEIIYSGLIIRKAFTEGDVAKIKSLHHPDVIKALGYNDIKFGRDEVVNGLIETLANFNLEFVKNDIESFLIKDDIVIEQTMFSIKGTPKGSGEPFIFNGRTMVTYVRYSDSPTGWAIVREIIQPE